MPIPGSLIFRPNLFGAFLYKTLCFGHRRFTSMQNIDESDIRCDFEQNCMIHVQKLQFKLVIKLHFFRLMTVSLNICSLITALHLHF